jgi:FkbM family methyltransferase
MVNPIALLKDLYHTRNLQEWVNHRYWDEKMYVIPREDALSLETSHGLRFFLDDQYTSIFECMHDYRIDSLYKGDIVLDIGANIGGFTLLAARKSEHVFALEPIFADRLRRNLEANSLHAHIIEGGLGGISGAVRTFEYAGHKNVIRTFTLADIIKMAGGCDFLKCDCEGAEWEIQPEELDGIRHIEMELHRMGSNHIKKFKALMVFLEKRYDLKMDIRPEPKVYGTLHAELK